MKRKVIVETIFVDKYSRSTRKTKKFRLQEIRHRPPSTRIRSTGFIGCFSLATILVFLLSLTITHVDGNPDAKRLYDDLLSNYNRLIRPVSNHTEKVTVKLGLRLSQLVDLVSTQPRVIYK